MADDIAAWLTAIWDEDERAARAVKPLSVVVVMGGERRPESFGHSRHTFASEDGYPRTLSDPEAMRHFARYEPSIVLARIAADRQILDQYRQAAKDCACLDTTRTMEIGVVAVLAERRALERVVRRLASAYATRPGYNEEWRP